MIAFQQNLMASAHAHHAMAKVVEASGRVARAKKNQQRGQQQSSL
jgi:hypothetical protein